MAAGRVEEVMAEETAAGGRAAGVQGVETREVVQKVAVAKVVAQQGVSMEEELLEEVVRVVEAGVAWMEVEEKADGLVAEEQKEAGVVPPGEGLDTWATQRQILRRT